MAIAPGAAVYVSIQKSGKHGSDKDEKALGNIYDSSVYHFYETKERWYMNEGGCNDDTTSKEFGDDEYRIRNSQRRYPF